jgi:NAD(P)-dependent dehydrogenase (short-subunit alcohol dehydrogenase family)
MSSLSSRVALVTGGSRGIGLAICRALIEEGVRVVATGKSESHLSEARRAIANDAAFETMAADVRDHEQVSAAVNRAVERFGGLDILVNNAGLGIFANVADLTVEQWREMIDTNLTGVFYACRAAIPELRRRGEAWIINISSLAGKNAFPGAAAYCASKAGLNAFSEAMMQEVRYDGIRVAYVMPGSVETGFAGAAEGADWKLAPEDVAQVVLDLIRHPARSLPSRVEIRPSRPKKRS